MNFGETDENNQTNEHVRTNECFSRCHRNTKYTFRFNHVEYWYYFLLEQVEEKGRFGEVDAKKVVY